MRHRYLLYSSIFATATLLATPFLHASGDGPSKKTHAAFEARIKQLDDTKLRHQLSRAERDEADPRITEGLEFLYAYMPLPDVLNYSPEFFRETVELAYRAKDEMPWGKNVPEREFLHFVLPVRVNNEDIDESRGVFFEELKDRVKGMSMKDAILEVNHWCHEKVTYQPSDARTSSPLSAVSQAIGRCGEESTFAVAALRSVGIPARQVYTPRWAHTDDNHAWVEAWADGEWYFLGACEPEPILNLAWFNAPASRGMLMTTKAFGDYDGPEEQIERTAINTAINVTSNYASVAPIEVIITDAEGNPAEGADVAFCLYNYSEYNKIAEKKSDRDGRASLTAGLGDMIVWATDGNKFGFAKANSKQGAPVKIVMDKDSRYEGTTEFDIVPPPVSATLPKPTAEQAAENERRKAYEDSVRTAYTATFATADEARSLAAEIDADPEKIVKILTESRGNHKAIADMLSVMNPDQRERAVDILLAVSEKDRRDMRMDVVADRLLTPEGAGELYRQYVINPRVELEGLTPFTEEFLADLTPEEAEAYRQDPRKWVEWTATNIAIDSVWNPTKLRVHPDAVWKAKIADPHSRNIFFVSSARAMGIPARIDQVTGKTQWHDGTDWVDVKFERTETSTMAPTPKGTLKLEYAKTGRIEDPVYYSQFTLSKIDDGKVSLLDYDETIPLSEINPRLSRLDAGQYILTTGQRMADGSVLARSTIFTLDEGEEKSVPLVLRQDETGIQVIGNFNSEDRYLDSAGNEKSLLSTTGRGYYTLIYGKPNHEPTSHVLNDISAVASDFEADGRKVMLIYGDEGQLQRAQLERFGKLPSNVVAGADIDGAILKELTENLHLTENDYPIVIVADTFNRVVFISQGYTIGMGEKLIDTLSRIQ